MSDADHQRAIRKAEAEAGYNDRRVAQYRAEGDHQAAARAAESAAEDRQTAERTRGQ